MPAAIETQILTRRFGDRVAVDGISMSVPERSIYGFLGRNGAGKTTTIKLLLGLLKADAGSAVAEFLYAEGIATPLLQLGLSDTFLEHASREELLAHEGLDASGIEAAVRRRFSDLLIAPALRNAV